MTTAAGARFASVRASGYGAAHSGARRSVKFVSDIFREIDDELRRENLLRLWTRYSRHIIAGAVLVALIAAGIFAWRQHVASERLARARMEKVS